MRLTTVLQRFIGLSNTPPEADSSDTPDFFRVDYEAPKVPNRKAPCYCGMCKECLR